jgi:hypothetical protein
LIRQLCGIHKPGIHKKNGVGAMRPKAMASKDSPRQAGRAAHTKPEKLMSTERSINPLLTQLCEELGFCSALRVISRFPSGAMTSPGKFVDAVFSAESLSMETDQGLTEQVRAVVDKHFAMWQKAEDA